MNLNKELGTYLETDLDSSSSRDMGSGFGGVYSGYSGYSGKGNGTETPTLGLSRSNTLDRSYRRSSIKRRWHPAAADPVTRARTRSLSSLPLAHSSSRSLVSLASVAGAPVHAGLRRSLSLDRRLAAFASVSASASWSARRPRYVRHFSHTLTLSHYHFLCLCLCPAAFYTSIPVAPFFSCPLSIVPCPLSGGSLLHTTCQLTRISPVFIISRSRALDSHSCSQIFSSSIFAFMDLYVQ